MRRFALFALMICAVPATAQDNWVELSGDEIREALTDRRLQYANAWQEFNASGRTLYNAGEDSWGYWRIQGDQYCSMWPPSDLWACYSFSKDGGVFRFEGVRGDYVEAVYAD